MLSPSKRKSVGSATLAPPLLGQENRGDAHVERLALRRKWNRDCGIACAPHEWAQPSPLGAEHDNRPAGEVRLPQVLRGVARGGVDPEVGTLDLGEVAREVRNDRYRQMLHRAGRRL